jgi:hypothetical protein
MAEELVTMSRKEIDRLEVIRRVLERRLSQVKAALSVLDLRQTSIDGEIYTGDERTLIGGEEYDGSCDFLELASPTEGNLRGPLRSRRVRRCDHVSLSRRHRAGPDLPRQVGLAEWQPPWATAKKKTKKRGKRWQRGRRT